MILVVVFYKYTIFCRIQPLNVTNQTIYRPATGWRCGMWYVVKVKSDKTKVQVLTARPTDEQGTGVAIRTVAGPLRIVSGKSIGFVRNVYVGADLLTQRLGLADQLVRVVAVARWDAVKQQSGWRAFQIEKESANLLAGA